MLRGQTRNNFLKKKVTYMAVLGEIFFFSIRGNFWNSLGSNEGLAKKVMMIIIMVNRLATIRSEKIYNNNNRPTFFIFTLLPPFTNKST